MKTMLTACGLLALAGTAFAQTSVPAGTIGTETWTKAGSPYILEGFVYVTGGTLTINPGVVVRGQPRTDAPANTPSGDPGALVVTRDGRIDAQGTVAEPIIFTTAAVDVDRNGIPDSTGGSYLDAWQAGDGLTNFYDQNPATAPLGPKAAGDIPGAKSETGKDSNIELWGGLIVLGRAPTNLGDAELGAGAPFLEGFIEGLPASANSQYGGSYPNDDSGILRYISVRHGGSEIGSGNEINGITLGGVGYGTTIEYCEVYMNYDDGVEFFGGTVNTNHMVVTFAGDDQFDGDQGWTGQNQFWVAVMPYFLGGASGGDKGFEFDGDDSNSNTNVDLNGNMFPYPQYTVYNATVVGADGATNREATHSDNGRLNLKSNYSGAVVASLVVSLGDTAGLSVSTSEPVAIEYCSFQGVDGTATSAVAAVTAGTSNFVNTSWTGLTGDDASGAAGLDLRPAFSFGGETSTSGLVYPNGLESVSYRGAVDPNAAVGSTWLADWTVLSINGVLVD